MVKDKRTNAYLIHLNKKELDMFKLKAKKYKQMSNMMRPLQNSLFKIC